MDPIIPQSLEPQYQPQVPEHKHFLNKKFAITFVVLILLGGGAYAGIQYWQNQQVVNEVVPTFTPRPSALPDPTAGWKTYTNTQYGFEVKYPDQMIVLENEEDNSGFKNIYFRMKDWQQQDRGILPSLIFHFDPKLVSPITDTSLSKAVVLSGGKIISDKSVLGNNEFIHATVSYVAGPGPEFYEYYILPTKNGSYVFESPNTIGIPFPQILSTFKFTDSVSGQFCGGIAGVMCPSGYTCKMDGGYPDAGGTCVKN